MFRRLRRLFAAAPTRGRSPRTRMGLDVALEARESPAVLALDGPDLSPARSVSHSDQIRVSPTPAATTGLAAGGIIINF